MASTTSLEGASSWRKHLMGVYDSSESRKCGGMSHIPTNTYVGIHPYAIPFQL